MNSSMNNIPRLGETKAKPKIGEIRITIDGTRRKIFDGKCWQYLCIGDPNCRIQAKFTCRNHRNIRNNTSLNNSTSDKIQQPKPGDINVLPNGNRRIWRGARWHSLCRVDNCFIQAKTFCKTHQNKRISLPNTNDNISEKSRLITRTRSCVLNDTTDTDIEQNNESSLIQNNISVESPTNKRRRLDDNIFETVAVSPLEKRELHTRNGRRVRCNGLIWKHLCADKKNPFYKRKNQRHTVSSKKTDQIIDTNQISSVSSDIINSSNQASPITQIKNSKKRKPTNDISNEEHIVPKRRTNGQRRKGSNKPIILQIEPNSSDISISDIPTKDKSIEESVLNDSDISLSLKSNRLNSNYQSIEIPVQSSSFNFDSSPSAILEQFGTIIKKEAEEDTLICVPSIDTNNIECPCETLKDFLRVEDMKKKEFKLDCQRISYRLAKIQDCIGNISSIMN